MSQIRLFLADDHTVMRAGIRLVLERQPDLHVVGEASDGRETVNAIERFHPDVVVMDIAMPNLNGIEATRQILANGAAVSIVVLSMHSDEEYVLRALKAGARGYLLKESAEADLIAAVRAVISGKSFFSPAVSRLLVEDYVRQLQDRDIEDSYDLLTTREPIYAQADITVQSRDVPHDAIVSEIIEALTAFLSASPPRGQ